MTIISIVGVITTISDKKKNAPPALETSRYEAWPAEFKQNFINECSSNVSEEKKRAYAIVCGCFAKRLEDEHVLPTQFNPVLSTESKFAQDISGRIAAYFNSPDGTKTKEICAAQARN